MEEEKQIVKENEELIVNEVIDALNEDMKIDIDSRTTSNYLEIIDNPYVDNGLEQPLFRDDENDNVIFDSDTNYLHVENNTSFVESSLTTTDSHEMVYKSVSGKNTTAPNKFGVKYKKERQRKNKQQKKSRKASRK
jgi:hypothetical protein